MTRPPSFVSAILLVLLATTIPSQSFATTIGSDAIDSSDSDSSKSKKKSKDGDGDDILEMIFTLGGLLGSNGGSSSDGSGGNSDGNSNGGTNGGTNGDSIPPLPDRCDDCPTQYPGYPGDGEGNPSAPVPEPSAALLFGFGILAAASRRNLMS